MAIAKMRLVNIISDKKHLNEVLSRFCSLRTFYPEPASKFVDSVRGLTTLQDANPYEEVLNHLKEISNEMGLELAYKDKIVSEIDVNEIKNYIDKTYAKYDKANEIREELEKVIQESKDALIQLQNIDDVDLSLDDIFSCQYLKVRFGRLPLDSVEKLKYYDNKPFIFRSFNNDSVYSWCMFITTPRYEGEVDNVFSSLYFERIRIPEFVHGTPENAEGDLKKEIEDDINHLQHVNDVINKMISECSENFSDIYSALSKLNTIFSARKFVVCLGERFSITGFVAKDDVNYVMEAFNDMKNDVEIENRPSHSDKRLTPPTKLKNGWLTRPFSFFIEMYGVPEYEGFDPTPFVAITYILLFGIMFGDLGQGIALMIVGYLVYKWKKMALGEIGIRIGLSSAVFGLLYGSFFGNEHILNGFYQNVFHMDTKPIEVLDASFTMTLLLSTVALGFVLICVSLSINTIMNFKKRNIGEACFSQNGVAGIIFYVSIVVGVTGMLTGVSLFSTPYVVILILLPLIIIFFKEPLCNKLEGKELFPDKFSGFFAESIFELFEICLTFLANTMSFLRVGGFVLSHAGMMLVVMTLAQMVGPTFAPLVLVIGNIFVMCMEGMIVGIQVLRLEFYEMFSRYFEGNGIEFKSIESN